MSPKMCDTLGARAVHQAPPIKPCKPPCKSGWSCDHATPTSKGVCVAPKVCKPVCKKPQTCDSHTGQCITPPPPPPQSCFGPLSASVVQLHDKSSSSLLAVWVAWRADGVQYYGSKCMAVSHDAGSSWQQLGTVAPIKSAAGMQGTFGVSPRLAYAPWSGPNGRESIVGPHSGGLVVMTVANSGQGYLSLIHI